MKYSKLKLYIFSTAWFLSLFWIAMPVLAQTNSPRKVVCLGDSITVGYGPKFRTPDDQTCTVNARIGRPTSEMVSELRSSIIGQGFTDLIIMGGTNDVVCRECTSQSTDRAINNLQTIYSEAKAAGMRVVAVTIPPAAGWYTNFARSADAYQNDVDRLNNAVRSGSVDAVVDAYALLGDPANPAYLNPTLASRDKLHPNAQGSELLAQTISSQGFGGGGGTASGPQITPPQQIITPELGINIPGINISQGAQDNNYLNLPFIADYITGLVRYLLGLAGVLAGIMLTIGGVQYLMAAGNKSAIDVALKRIKNALFGLLLALSSYTILYAINPRLVSFSALRIEATQQVLLTTYDQPGGIDYGGDTSFGAGEQPRISRQSADPIYDSVFQKYAGCAGIDWRILKAIAWKESHFNENITNRFGFTGLFQTKARFCPLGNYGRASDCQNLTNPDNNTASAVVALALAANTIRNRCPNIDTRNFVTLLYISHNSGVGAMNAVLNNPTGGCTGNFESALASFWAGRNSIVTNGASRATYARSVASQAAGYGVQNPFVEGECPLTPQ